jgi:hypothetical protein
MDVEKITAVIAYMQRRKQKLKMRQKLWVHPFVADHPISGMFCKIYSDSRKYPDKFFSYPRLSIVSFDELLTTCEMIWLNKIPFWESKLVQKRSCSLPYDSHCLLVYSCNIYRLSLRMLCSWNLVTMK